MIRGLHLLKVSPTHQHSLNPAKLKSLCWVGDSFDIFLRLSEVDVTILSIFGCLELILRLICLQREKQTTITPSWQDYFNISKFQFVVATLPSLQGDKSEINFFVVEASISSFVMEKKSSSLETEYQIESLNIRKYVDIW